MRTSTQSTPPIHELAQMSCCVAEAADDLRRPLMALEAVEALTTPTKADSREDLSLLEREALAWLLAVISIDLRRTVQEVQSQAHVAHVRLREAASTSAAATGEGQP